MRTKIMLACTAVAVALTVTACGTLFTQKPTSASLIVTSGLGTTNDSNAVNYLGAAQKLNASLNVTPTEPLINNILIGLGALAAAFGGWYARNHSAATTTASATAASQQAIKIAAIGPPILPTEVPPLIPPKS
jgi:hypothetical protein